MLKEIPRTKASIFGTSWRNMNSSDVNRVLAEINKKIIEIIPNVKLECEQASHSSYLMARIILTKTQTKPEISVNADYPFYITVVNPKDNSSDYSDYSYTYISSSHSEESSKTSETSESSYP